MKCSICAIIKNEQLFLKEWIDWHLSIGFDSIYLCEDIGSTSHKEITDQYCNVTLLQYNDDMSQYENGRGAFRQYAFYSYFIKHYKHIADWCAFIDVDEFIHIEDNKNIKELLSDYDKFNALYIYWKFYNANNHIKRPIGLIQNNYIEEIETDSFDNGWKYKSIANFNKPIKMISVHNIINGVNSFKMKTHRIRTYHKIWINHYFTKSWEDWCERFISRGDAHPGHRKIEDFFKLNPTMLSKKDELMKFYEEKVAANRK